MYPLQLLESFTLLFKTLKLKYIYENAVAKQEMSFTDLCPTFAYVDDNIRLFLFNNFYVALEVRDGWDNPSLWVKPCGQGFPPEIKVHTDSIARLDEQYNLYAVDQNESTRQELWLPTATKLEGLCTHGLEEFSGVEFASDISTENLAEKLQ